ncbi:hypothetical protein SAMN05216391_10578 [Lachnospiraceae bacterium KHCPX20]|nr:hypothetical protein SAMN05216391_10578 [Lachnospiraceae bacterium KHCPX20]
MLNKPYKTLLATLVLATGLSVVPASTVQAEVVHITLEDGTEADVERSEIHEYIAQHYGGTVTDSDEGSDTEHSYESYLKDKDGNLIKGRNGVYYKKVKAYREPCTKKNMDLVEKGKKPKGVHYTKTLAMDLDGNELYEVGKKTPFTKPANSTFYAIKGTDDLFIYSWENRDTCIDCCTFATLDKLEWALEAKKNPGYQRDDILPYLKVTCSKPDMLKITDRKNGGKSFKWVKTGTCKITLELDSYKISYPVKVLSNTTKNNILAVRHNVLKKGMSAEQRLDAVLDYLDNILNKPKKEFDYFDHFKFVKWIKKNNPLVNRCYGYSYMFSYRYSCDTTIDETVQVYFTDLFTALGLTVVL